ncbi:NADPH:quinone reductase [Micractinium conductrix]|uniref:NADPH:quinone reductase n=1 Tax=Micractinium conductrix TaxID=554055 RepID=A0A2P6VPU3_9CHLO|nr:NADPH:quinone reductase [Micractinium conductrix]|eukprot:PSC76124.1 NADPH:quinone reductase [Micractinium conductrix]
MRAACLLLACLLLVAMQAASGAPRPSGQPTSAPAAAPAPPGCAFTLRVDGQLIPVAEAPEVATRYIISAHSMEQRTTLQHLLEGALAGPAPTSLTATMPLLVGNLSRTELLWLCQDPQASACVNYIESDQKVSLW